MPDRYDQNPRAQHWQRVWRDTPATRTSWFQSAPTTSHTLIAATGIARSRPVIDIGGGASRLVDHLLEDGFRDVTVLDLSEDGLRHSQTRLGQTAAQVTWITADITFWTPPSHYAVWHDRAVFHFLITPEDQAQYVAGLDAGLATDGQAFFGCFAPDGPESCSGLPIQRHDAGSMQAIFGRGFEIVETRAEDHQTPAGKTQRFNWFRVRRRVE